MIGDMLAKARIDKGLTKSELSSLTGINVGHLTHIEKGERNPSHKALMNICQALGIPYIPLMFTYDKELNDEQKDYNVTEHISYNKILAIDNIDTFIDCPTSVPSSAIAVKVNDNSMEPTFEKNSYVYVELNSPLNSKEYGVFEYNGEIFIRKFISKKGKIILKADNKNFGEIKVFLNDNFYIIGKILRIK